MIEKVSKNIARHELACSCGCGFDVCDIVLVNTLQEITDHFARKYSTKGRVYIQLTGGNRCILHNEEVQSKYYADRGETYKAYSSKSQHIFGKAADFKIYIMTTTGVQQVSPSEIYEYIDNKWPDRFGLGLYHNRCHLDSRQIKARWRH